jgi:hypothetical protein
LMRAFRTDRVQPPNAYYSQWQRPKRRTLQIISEAAEVPPMAIATYPAKTGMQIDCYRRALCQFSGRPILKT